MQLTAMIQIRIKEQTPYGEFNDSLYYTPEQYKIISQEELKKAAQARVATWISAVENPPSILPDVVIEE